MVSNKNTTKYFKRSNSNKKNKHNTGDTVKGLAICDRILYDYEDVNEDIYMELINNIYTNIDIARTSILDFYSDGRFSFLLMSLWNPYLKLTEEQKNFAVNEAMNKFGTTRYSNGKDTSDINVYRARVHGSAPFDIRYHILRNPNWTLEEKQQLIMDFWSDDKVYDETLEQWEWFIINDYVNDLNEPTLCLEKDFLYEYSYQYLLDIYKHKKVADEIWSEIQFCKQMHKLRPAQYEIDGLKRKRNL